MLVLNRKRNETICIGEEIFVTVTRIKGSRVQLAIEAPSSLGIRRAELGQVTIDTVLAEAHNANHRQLTA